MNIRKGLNKTYSLLMVATGDKFALIYATDVVMQLMFGSGIRVAYNMRFKQLLCLANVCCATY